MNKLSKSNILNLTETKFLFLIILVFPSILVMGYPVAGYLLLPIFLFCIFLIKRYKIIKYNNYHGIAFGALILFMIASVFVSIFAIQDLRLLIFVPFFLSLFLLDKFLGFYVVFDRKFYNLLIKYGFYYAAFYLFIGLIAFSKYEDFHAFQGIYFAGSSVAVFPIFFVLIFIPYLINVNDVSRKYLCLFFIAAVLVSIAYESRALIFTIFGTSFFMVFFNKKFKLSLILIFLLLNAPVFFLPSEGYRGDTVVGKYIPVNTELDQDETNQSILRSNDQGRFKTVIISIEALFDTSPLIGNGFYSGRILLKPFYVEERPNSKISNTLNNSPLQLATLPALIFDLGLFGCFLLILNLSFVFFRLKVKLNFIKQIHFLFVLFVFLSFSFVGTNFVLPMFYIFMMPSFVKIFFSIREN